MVKILQNYCIVRDGWHNFLVDITYWRGYYWLAYSRRMGHYAGDARIIVLKSLDLKRWHQVADIDTEGNDWCPKLCGTKDRLWIVWFATFPEIAGGRNMMGDVLNPEANPAKSDVDYGPPTKLSSSDVPSLVCYSKDGITWSDPIPVWKNEHMWSLRVFDDVFYSAAWGWFGDAHEHIHGPLDFLRSEDGIHWEKVSRIAEVNPDRPDETDLYFQPDGEVWAIAATWRYPKDHSVFYASKPPYKTWERHDLKATIRTPCFCPCDDQLYVVGRSDIYGYPPELWPKPQSTPPGTTVIYTVTKGQVHPFFALPSMGDVWQQGLISTEPGKLICAYNSQHAYMTGVLPSKIPIPPMYVKPDVYISDNDVYIAKLQIEPQDKPKPAEYHKK